MRPRTLHWYAARARAMSTEEIAWRVRAELRRRMARSRSQPSELRWNDAAWSTIVRTVTGAERESLVEDAARVAEGHLDLWGHAVRVDPRGVAWATDPLDGVGFSSADWRRSGRDWKPIWELHRQQHLLPLAAGAAFAGREDWGETCLRQILDWIASNPPRRGPGWSSGYEVAHRLVGWSWVIPLVVEHAPPAALDAVSKSFVAQARFVAERPSRYSSANNHRLAEITGLLAAARLGVNGLSWDDLWAELEAETLRQTFEDGGSREHAAGYFLYVLEILWVAVLLARAEDRSTGILAERLASILGWLEAVGNPAGEPPTVGDDAEDRLVRLDYFAGRRASALAARVRAVLDGAGEPPRRASESSVVLPESGYAVLRGELGGLPVRIVMDVGDLGLGALAAHGHADALSVMLDIDHRPVLRDSGSETYAPGRRRDADRSTQAHNTVVVNGRSQAEPLGPHLWGRRYETTLEAAAVGRGVDYVRGSHDGYAHREGAVHTRSTTFLKPDVLLVIDRVRASRACDIELNWQLSETADEVRLSVVCSLPHESREERVPYSPRYTWTRTAPRRTFSARGTEVVFATVVDLTGSGDAPRVALRHDGGETTVEIDRPREATLVERWTESAIGVRP